MGWDGWSSGGSGGGSITERMTNKKFENDKKLAAKMAKKIAAEKKQDAKDRKGK